LIELKLGLRSDLICKRWKFLCYPMHALRCHYNYRIFYSWRL